MRCWRKTELLGGEGLLTLFTTRKEVKVDEDDNDVEL